MRPKSFLFGKRLRFELAKPEAITCLASMSCSAIGSPAGCQLLAHAVLLRTDDDFDEGDEFCLASWDQDSGTSMPASREWKGFLHAANDVFHGLTGAGVSIMHFELESYERGSRERTAVFFACAQSTLTVLCFLGHLADGEAKELGEIALDLVSALTGPGLFCCPQLPQSSRESDKDELVIARMSAQEATFRSAFNVASMILAAKISNGNNNECDDCGCYKPPSGVGNGAEREAALSYVDRAFLHRLGGATGGSTGHYREAKEQQHNIGSSGSSSDGDIPEKVLAPSSPLLIERGSSSSLSLSSSSPSGAASPNLRTAFDGAASAPAAKTPAILLASSLWSTKKGLEPSLWPLLAYHGPDACRAAGGNTACPGGAVADTATATIDMLRLALATATIDGSDAGSEVAPLPADAVAAVERVTSLLATPETATATSGAASPVTAHVVRLHLPYRNGLVKPSSPREDFEVGASPTPSSHPREQFMIPQRCSSSDALAQPSKALPAASASSSYFARSPVLVVRIPALDLAVAELVGPGTFLGTTALPAGEQKCACKSERSSITWPEDISPEAAASPADGAIDLLPSSALQALVTDACAAMLSFYSRSGHSA